MKMNETKCTTDAKWICCTANVLSLRTLELNHRQKLYHALDAMLSFYQKHQSP